MKTITVPAAMTIDLGYRKLKVEPGTRTYPDEVANHPKMAALWEPDPAPKAEGDDDTHETPPVETPQEHA